MMFVLGVHAPYFKNSCTIGLPCTSFTTIKLDLHLLCISVFIQWEVIDTCISAALKFIRKKTFNYFSRTWCHVFGKSKYIEDTSLFDPYLHLVYTCSQIYIAWACPVLQEGNTSIFKPGLETAPAFQSSAIQFNKYLQ